MSHEFAIGYFSHSLRSDWNNGNAHFLRGLIRAIRALGHRIEVFEPDRGWSYSNLHTEILGKQSLELFSQTYPDIHIRTYNDTTGTPEYLRSLIDGLQFVIVHEWNPPELAHTLLTLRNDLGFKLVLHDTHHRAFSSPEQIRLLDVEHFDGVVTFGGALSSIYRERFGVGRVWTLQEAADITIFHPRAASESIEDVVWIGNWGDGERSNEIRTYLLQPACHLRQQRFSVYGVRYPQSGLSELTDAGVRYAGYLPNLLAPDVYARAQLTVHIPRQQYSHAMDGIPTIRIFEALACGIPLISAPWHDSEHLFGCNDFLMVSTSKQMQEAIVFLLEHPDAAAAQAARGLQTILNRHTCMHRAHELQSILQELS